MAYFGSCCENKLKSKEKTEAAICSFGKLPLILTAHPLILTAAFFQSTAIPNQPLVTQETRILEQRTENPNSFFIFKKEKEAEFPPPPNRTLLRFVPLPNSFPFPLLHEPTGLLVLLRRLLLRLFGLQSLQFGVVVVGNAQKRQAVAEQVDRGHGVLDHGPRKGDQEPVFHHSGHIHRQRRGLSDQQEHGQIQSKCADRIGPKNQEIEMEARRIAQNRLRWRLWWWGSRGEKGGVGGGDVKEEEEEVRFKVIEEGSESWT
ncbi:hypothetical protein DVH24_021087 [Malus domestica]|uniref:Uncharacterized protein n=1 Tax=Malus domestica TaxID=3750 RepID=A0A498JDE4_MALDO|nr:hypothetical protein DVH24_021087 [Malus domestica]